MQRFDQHNFLSCITYIEGLSWHLNYKQIMTAEIKKIKSIKQIADLQDEDILKKVELLLDSSKNVDPMVESLLKPIKEKIDIEQLKKEQNYQSFDKKEIDRLIKEIDLQEPLEDLINMI